MALDREYKIEASSRQCHTCGRVFVVQDDYYSAVVEMAEDQFVRQDFCPDCWNPEHSYFSFWKTRVPRAEAPSRGPRFVDMERLLQLFQRLEEQEDGEAQRFRYVLALVLMRKRRLRLLSSRRLKGGSGEELTVREVGAGREYVVTCPSLSETELAGVADRLREILDMPEKWTDDDEK
jgi:tRNA U54 and U55 pseudouridine synthase Pus10